MYYILFAILSNTDILCYNLRCGIPSPNNATSLDCSSYDRSSNTHYVDPCPDNFVCNRDLFNGQCVYQSHFDAGTQVSGTSCIFDRDCVRNNKCIDSYCKGAVLGENAQSTVTVT